MESGGDAVDDDDQGSGWMQVKKKHRSYSRFSLHGLVGGISGKQSSHGLRNQPAPNLKSRSSDINCDMQPVKTEEVSVVHDFVVVNNIHDTNANNGVHYLDKCVVSQGNDSSNLIGGHYESPDVLPKIKWGNLDDSALMLPCGSSTRSGIRFGDIGEVDADNSALQSSSCIGIKKDKLVTTSTEAGKNCQESLPFSPEDEKSDQQCEEVKELITMEDLKSRITNEQVVGRTGDVSSSGEAFHEDAGVIENNPSGPSGESAENNRLCEAGDSENSIVTADSLVVSLCSDNLPNKSEELECTVASPNEDSGNQLASSIVDDSSHVQTMSSTAGGDAGESKERFRQRLWCFLFENLNRAVDELYLLCELECDIEQMKEAYLVLEEAASDFKELSSRIEEFEKVKGSSHLSDGLPMAMKAEHRRPHALSWEVRRMTTSPHRAEILSSSLEAFKKIQQERALMHASNDSSSIDMMRMHDSGDNGMAAVKETSVKPRKQSSPSVPSPGSLNREKRNVDMSRSSKVQSVQHVRCPVQNPTLKDGSGVTLPGKSRREIHGSSEIEKLEKNPRSADNLKKHVPLSETDKERRNDQDGALLKSMDAWKQKRNWEDILASPLRVSYRFSHSPGMSRKSAERARVLRDKLLSPEKKKKTAVDLKKEAEEKHARAMRIRSELENERVQKLQQTSKKLDRVSEWQAIRSSRLREGMHARHQRGESRHEAHLAQVVRRAGDESSKVNEVRFITSLNEENKKLMLLQKHQDSELRRAEKLKDIKSRQKEDMAREAVLERRKLIEAEKLQRLAEIQKKKEEAQLRREEERKASSAAREAKAMEQMRRKELRAKAQQEEAELLSQKLAERLRESEQRRKFYLEQIRERASMDFRDQSSPLMRRSINNKENLGKVAPANSIDDDPSNSNVGVGGSNPTASDLSVQHSLKRRIKKIRQKLMALKYEPLDSSSGTENSGVSYRAAMGTARAKIGRWLQELQRHRQARKEGAASIGLVTAEIIKFVKGKDPELQASCRAGLLDFIASALPASHASKPEACQVTVYLLRLLRVVLSLPANRSYFLAQNLLPPIIPMLAAALENFIKIAASSNESSTTNLLLSKTSYEESDVISEVLDGFLWVVAAILGHASSDERQLQMQDGLLELVIAYQVIHRLRDLFALYDRPQVECSPFPSSILLSINLLAVLTSRTKTTPSIDWESFTCGMTQVNGYQENRSAQVEIHSTSTSLPDVPEEQPLDESCDVKLNNYSSMHNHDSASGVSLNFLREAKSVSCKDEDISSFSETQNVKSGSCKKDEENTSVTETKTVSKSGVKQPVAYLLLAIDETGLVCLPSLLTAVLLQANNRSSSEQASYVLPSNFEEVATGVLKVLNNLALININFIQRMLARADLKMELFHLMSFLLSHCTTKWGVATDQTGLLLLESLTLLGYFALFHSENQAVLRWGKSPTILHKVCDLPFVFFSDPELMPVLAGTIVAACYGCEQNKGVVQQELSIDMLLSLLKACRNLTFENPSINESAELTPSASEAKKLLGDISQRSTRCNPRNTRVQSIKGGNFGNNSNGIKARSQRDCKTMKLPDDSAVKQNISTFESSSGFIFNLKTPGSFIDKAEQFFSTEVPL